MSTTDRLGEIQARANAATEGPWWAPETTLGLTNTTVFGPGMSHTLYHSRDHETANFVAHARTDVPTLVGALRAVLDLHAPVPVYELRDEFGGFATDEDGERKLVTTLCRECSSEDAIDSVEDQEWTEDWAPEVQHPCPTVRAVEAALNN